MKEGDIVKSKYGAWVGIYRGKRASTCHIWSIFITPDNNFSTKAGGFSSSVPANEDDIKRFKRVLAKNGYSYKDGKLIQEF